MAITSATTANPYKITGTTATTTSVTTNIVWIQKIVWDGVTTAGHILSLSDKAGNTLYTATADAPGSSGKVRYSDEWPLGLPVSGIQCDDMDSGTLFIYLKP